MSIRLYKSYTPGTRNRALSSFSEITTDKPEKSLVKKNHRNKGRNNRGVITIRHRGGGHKKQYRIIDFKRNKHSLVDPVAYHQAIPQPCGAPPSYLRMQGSHFCAAE